MSTLRTPGWRRTVMLRRVAAIILAVAAAGTGLRSATAPPPGTVAVVVASREAPAGRPLDAADVTEAQIPHEAVPERAVTNPDTLIGQVPVAPLTRGEVLTDLRVATPALAAVLADIDTDGTPAAAHVVSVRTTDLALTALLHTGDRVDVIAAAHDGDRPEVIAAGGRVLLAPQFDGSDDPALLLALPAESAAQVAAAGLSGPLGVVLSPSG